jgi:hypothetical protein
MPSGQSESEAIFTRKMILNPDGSRILSMLGSKCAVWMVHDQKPVEIQLFEKLTTVLC